MKFPEIKFDEGAATLIAAVVSAVASLATLLSNKPTEIRAANRKTIEAYIPDLADSIHQIIASSNMLLEAKTDESRKNWKGRAEVAKKKLKELRPKIRYPLWGIEKPLRTLTRLPDYTSYTLEHKPTAKLVVIRGSALGDHIDNCIRRCYMSGRTPRFYEIWKLNFYSWRFIKVRDEYKRGRAEFILMNNK